MERELIGLVEYGFNGLILLFLWGLLRQQDALIQEIRSRDDKLIVIIEILLDQRRDKISQRQDDR